MHTSMIAALVAWFFVAQQSAPPPPSGSVSRADRPPTALVQIGSSGKLLFDAADASDWSTGADALHDMNEAQSMLPETMPKGDVVEQLRSRLEEVQQSVLNHRRVETMSTANGITRLVAELSGQFETRVPFEALMLGFYSRQLELGIASAQSRTTSQARIDLKSTWTVLEPTVERLGHIDEARRFTDIVVQLDGARRPADFVSPTRAALAEAERIESLLRST